MEEQCSMEMEIIVAHGCGIARREERGGAHNQGTVRVAF